jgi:SAM-dependent methyltransferase
VIDDSTQGFYDGLSGDYHLLFEDWAQSIRRQSDVLDRLLHARLGARPLTVLDCCCGIGTQAIGLALLGHRVHATDISTQAVSRAASEAAAFGVALTLGVADVRLLQQQVEGTFDAVIACDNALPHLLSDDDLLQGVRGMAAKLRPGGLFLASIRDYDTLTRERAAATPVRVHAGPPCRRAVFQVWDWSPDGRTYRMHHFILKEGSEDWGLVHHTALYRALLRDELTAIMQGAGLIEVRWHTAEESGYYQPIVTALGP